MDALALLKADHDRVKSDLSRLLEVPTAERSDLFRQVEAQLRAHETVEEEILYPALKEHPEAREEVLEAFEEHHLVDEVLGQLDALPPEAEDWHAKAQVMTEQVQHHIEEEESEMFPEARRAFDADALERMGQRMAGRKKELLAAGDGKR